MKAESVLIGRESLRFGYSYKNSTKGHYYTGEPKVTNHAGGKVKSKGKKDEVSPNQTLESPKNLVESFKNKEMEYTGGILRILWKIWCCQ